MSDARIVKIEVKEYDNCGGCSECVHRDSYPAPWLGTTEKTVRNFLASGDYSEGDERRYVEVYLDGAHHRTYTAPQIRRFKLVAPMPV